MTVWDILIRQGFFYYYYSRYDFCRNTDKRMGQSCEKVLGEKYFSFNSKINVSTKMA